MSVLSTHQVDVIMAAMREAGRQEILPRFQMLGEGDIRIKSGPDDVVTDADIGAERLLGERLGALFPGAAIVGEEAVADDASVLDAIGNAEIAIIIDPVDGTWNFANALPVFGTIIAVVMGGETVAGFIHYPVMDDFIMALKGEGAWHVAANGARRKLAVSPATPVGEMAGFVALPQFSPAQQVVFAPRMLEFSRTTTFRCSAYEYRLIAEGSMAFCLNAGLMAWDHAAGHLIHSESGGYGALLSGEIYRPTMKQGHLLLAPDRQSWELIRAVFEGQAAQ